MGFSGNITVFIVIGLFLVWGIYGGVQTKSIGYSCSLGVPGTFCLLYSENMFGAMDRVANDFANAPPDPAWERLQLKIEEKDRKIEEMKQQILEECLDIGFEEYFLQANSFMFYQNEDCIRNAEMHNLNPADRGCTTTCEKLVEQVHIDYSDVELI